LSTFVRDVGSYTDERLCPRRPSEDVMDSLRKRTRRSPIGDERKAVAYVRVSTEEQLLGPKAQEDAIRAWSEKRGVSVVGWHVDQGVSGGTELGDRPGLMSALDALRDERAGLLVVAKRDRPLHEEYR
jgi:hypothetical protein